MIGAEVGKRRRKSKGEPEEISNGIPELRHLSILIQM